MFTKEQTDAILEMQQTGGGRSSSASHFSKEYETASVGVAEDVFYGVQLNNNMLEVDTVQLLIVIALLLLLHLPQRPTSLGHPPKRLAAVLGAVLAAAPQTTSIPLLTTIIYTRTAYPYMVVIPHCIVACATYRRVHHIPSALQSLVGSFFLYGFGGSIVSDILMGLPATALSHPRIIPCHVLGWILVNYSPSDWVFRTLNSKTILRYLLSAMEAIDAVTTPMGRVSRSARDLRNKTTAPIVAGVLAGVGGGSLRYIAGEPGASSGALETAFWKTLSYATLWWYLAVYRCDNGFHFYGNAGEEALEEWNHCGSYNGSDLTRVVLVGAHTISTLLVEFGVASGHPLVWMCQALFVDFGSQVCSTMGWGPPLSNYDSDSGIDDDSSKKKD